MNTLASRTPKIMSTTNCKETGKHLYLKRKKIGEVTVYQCPDCELLFTLTPSAELKPFGIKVREPSNP
jgi:hypothetical protein